MYHIHVITKLSTRSLLVTNSKFQRSHNIEAITITLHQYNKELNIFDVYARPHASNIEIKTI